MQKRVAILEPNDRETLPHATAQRDGVAATAPQAAGTRSVPPAPEGTSASTATSQRFQYSSGDRPLAGFAIKRGVGQGGFGEIYYAQSDAGKDVALKLIRRNLDVELRGIRQCLNLKHPNLLDIYDIRQDERGDTWVVMEYVANENLEDLLAERPNGLPPQDALVWIHGIAAGVAYLHERGIVHRDLKPGNIFCDEGVVKVGDYGLSKFISCSRRSGHTESIGTVHYMAPEVANGRYGKEIDVYALGVILYELLTGRVPFEGESAGEVLMKHLTAKPDVSMLPEPYRGVVAHALEKDPELRFRSAAEMTAALPAPADVLFMGARPAVAPCDTEPRAPVACNKAATDGRAQSGAAQPVATIRRGFVASDRAAEAPVAKDNIREEPILRAIRDNWKRLRRGWDEANLNLPLRILILVAASYFLLVSARLWLPLAIMLCPIYLVYLVVWLLVGGGASEGRRLPTASPRMIVTSPAAAGATAGLPSSAESTVAQTNHGTRYEKPLSALVLRPPRERLAELLGSLLLSSLVAAAMCVVMLLINSYGSGVTDIPRPEQFAWLLLVSVCGSWAVLIPSKFWEGLRGDATLRRFLLMVIGMGVGAIAFAVSEELMVGLPAAAGYAKAPAYKPPVGFYAVDGRPLLMAHVACFGTLFLLMRWWRQADPLRPTRLSLWRLLVSAVVAAMVAAAWDFPQLWLPMVAATMSVSIQLASPWLPPRERGSSAKRMQHTAA